MLKNYKFTPALTAAPATVPVAPNNAIFGVTDFAGTTTKDASKIRLTRSISDGQGFENTAPNARIRFMVAHTEYSEVKLKFTYTGLVTRLDTYNAIGSVFVNDSWLMDFDGPAPHISGNPHPTGDVNVIARIGAGTYVIDIVFPYCASVDFKGVEFAASATFAAAPGRPSKKGVFFGDSITQGFNFTKARLNWADYVATAKASQIINYGYGGRVLTTADGTTAGAMGCDYAVYLIGFNNFLPGGGSTSTFKNNYKTLLGNFRTASTAAGKPNAKFYAVTPFDAPSAYGAGAYASNSPTLEAFRQAIRDAVTEKADGNVVLLEGLGAGMPTGSANFADGIHPNDVTRLLIGPTIAAQIA